MKYRVDQIEEHDIQGIRVQTIGDTRQGTASVNDSGMAYSLSWTDTGVSLLTVMQQKLDFQSHECLPAMPEAIFQALLAARASLS